MQVLRSVDRCVAEAQTAVSLWAQPRIAPDVGAAVMPKDPRGARSL